MSMFVIMNPDKTRIYSINPCDNGPDMALIEKLGTEIHEHYAGPLWDFVLNAAWLPQLFPRRDWAEAIAKDFCGEYVIAEVTIL